MRLGHMETGRNSAPSWRYRADWIPAYAGMTAGFIRLLSLE